MVFTLAGMVMAPMVVAPIFSQPEKMCIRDRRYCDRFLFLKNSHVYDYGGSDIMTEEQIEAVYQIHVHIHNHNGVKVVIPYPDEKTNIQPQA